MTEGHQSPGAGPGPGSHGSWPVPAGQDNTCRHPAAHGRLAVTIATPGKLTSYDSPLHLPWLWGRCPLQLGGLPATQGQPTKCPAVGQACWNRAKSRHLLTPRNLRHGILSLCPDFQLSGQQLSDYDSGLGLNTPHLNELRLAVTPPLAVGPRSTPAGRTAWHLGTTLQVSGSRAGMLDQS